VSSSTSMASASKYPFCSMAQKQASTPRVNPIPRFQSETHASGETCSAVPANSHRTSATKTICPIHAPNLTSWIRASVIRTRLSTAT
jgi:hypothetical protein